MLNCCFSTTSKLFVPLCSVYSRLYGLADGPPLHGGLAPQLLHLGAGARGHGTGSQLQGGMVDSEIDASVNIQNMKYLFRYSLYSAEEAATEHCERAIL